MRRFLFSILVYSLCLIYTILFTHCQFLTPSESSEIIITFLNVGQGDAQIIQTQNKTVFIDVGNDSLTIQKWIQKNEIDTIDLIVITHPDLDHYGSLTYLINSTVIKRIILPQENKITFTWQQVLSLIEHNQIPNSQVLRGAKVNLELQTELRFLWPNSQTRLNGNNLSYVTHLIHGENRVLFTGDIEQETELEILQFKDSLKSNILKVAHHGSSSSSSLPFLNKVSFDWAIISSDSSIFGHPHHSTLQRLLLFIHLSKIYRTDQKGHLIFNSNLKSIQPAF